MKQFFNLSIILVLFLHGLLFSQNTSSIASIIRQVNADSLMKNLYILSGGEDVYLNKIVRINSRNRSKEGNVFASQYLKKKMETYGLKVMQQSFLTDGENIYSIQKGEKYSNKQIIICAHYDDMPSADLAPGADDNGSGTCAILEAARILSKMKFDNTIIYAFWDLEEQGLLGSNYYAKQAASLGDSIIAVINLDMIGYDSNNDYSAEVNIRDVANSIKLGQILVEVNKNYFIGINLKSVNPGITSSDHSSFWQYNYSAICLIESLQDFNKYYHQPTDDLTKINLEFFQRVTKLAIGTAATIAGSTVQTNISSELPKNFQLSQNYPNPFNPATTFAYQIPFDGYVQLKIVDLFGREIQILIEGVQSSGTHSYNFVASDINLTSGIYFYYLKFGGYSIVKKMILLK